MNKRMKMTLAAVAAMFVIAACSNKTEETVSAGENAVPEASSGEMLMDGLEYLLSEEKEDIIQIPETQESKEGSEEDSVNRQEKQENTVSDNMAEEAESVQIILYYSNGTFDSLDSEIVEVENKTAETIISALSRHNIVSLDTKVNSFKEEEMVGGKRLRLDLSRAMDDYLRTMTREAESIIIASVTDTFLDNFEADSICITVEGKPLTTPYAVYDKDLKKCMPLDLMEAEENEEEEGSEDGRN